MKNTHVIELLKKCSQKKSIITTSAGATSLVLIDLLYRAKVNIPVILIDTGFLFPETIEFFNSFKKRYPSLNFITIQNNISKENFFINNKIENIEFCCKKNKIDVIRDYLIDNKIEYWITGPRKEQTDARKSLIEFQKTNIGIIKVHPLLEWTEKEMIEYLEKRNLPVNPLNLKGYESIGCYPCTNKGSGREGRWKGEKTECGLHLHK